MNAPIYISRAVNMRSANALRGYAQAIGLPPEKIVPDMHVTLAFSRAPVDWNHPMLQPDPTHWVITGGTEENRRVKRLDGGAVVLPVESNSLTMRWMQFIGAGASWDHPSYQPHVTLAYDEDFDTERPLPAFTHDIGFWGETREPLILD